MATAMPRERGVDEPSAVREEGLKTLNAIANEHRIRILRALATADEPLSFSELRRSVDDRTPSGTSPQASSLSLWRCVSGRGQGCGVRAAG
jgi:DNA-binding HxlR family transcriptional regulator